MSLLTLEVGDEVICSGYTSFCSTEVEKVTKVTYKCDESTGEKYKIVHLGSRQFDSRNGSALTPPTMYYITSRNEKVVDTDQHLGYL